jgi:hypothetical protein
MFFEQIYQVIQIVLKQTNRWKSFFLHPCLRLHGAALYRIPTVMSCSAQPGITPCLPHRLNQAIRELRHGVDFLFAGRASGHNDAFTALRDRRRLSHKTIKISGRSFCEIPNLNEERHSRIVFTKLPGVRIGLFSIATPSTSILARAMIQRINRVRWR